MMVDLIETTGMRIRRSPNAIFSFVILLSFILFFGPITRLFHFSLGSEVYSYIPIIPLATVFLIYSDRKRIFIYTCDGFAAGGMVLLLAPILYLAINRHWMEVAQDWSSTLFTLCFVSFWIGGFLFAYGVQTFRNAIFPLLFLVLMVPLPDSMLDLVITALQHGSFWVAYSIFKMVGVEASASGFVVILPGLGIEVARECSGIRSALSLFVTSLLAGHLFLDSPVKKVILALSSFPIAVFKNGVRIVVLSLGAIYVDEGFLSGPLHRRGGVAFFFLSLVLLALMIWLLRSFGRPEGKGNST